MKSFTEMFGVPRRVRNHRQAAKSSAGRIRPTVRSVTAGCDEAVTDGTLAVSAQDGIVRAEAALVCTR